MTRKRLMQVEATTPLERHVKQWIVRQAADYTTGIEGVIRDVNTCGCEVGLVSHLFYVRDTVKFYKRYRHEIDGLLRDLCEDSGTSPQELFGDKWDRNDPLARECFNMNLLAWMGFEETARALAARAGIEA